MNDIDTNRDFYLFIADLVQRHAERSITLECYLVNLQQLGRAQRELAVLSLTTLARLLEAAFASPCPIDARPKDAPAEGYAEWEERVGAQIRDLREMREDGMLADEYRFFGVDAPSGARWYNFEPCAYLECAAAGTFGGWQEGDPTGRACVPGPVATLDTSGAMISMDPRDIDEPVIELREITWRGFVEFLEAGQCYE